MSIETILSALIVGGLLLAGGALAVYGVIEVLASKDRGGE